MPSFHEPLNHNNREIRVLELNPASDTEDAIRCNLKTVPLAKEPEYFALSYVWGDSYGQQSISVNGTPFQATRNLCTALRRMRNDAFPVTLWIDAICINQDDNEEKSRKIRMMRDIYQSAAIVIIWLGERDIDSYKAMETLFATAKIGKNPNLQENFKQELILHGLQQDGVLTALGKFFQRPWWNRVWVIQEAAVAQRAMFLCGDKPLDWRCFLDTYLLWTEVLRRAVQSNQLSPTLQYLKHIIDGTSARVIMWQHVRMHQPAGLSQLESMYGLQGMLEESWNFDSTDPRDKVYAWLGLLIDTDIAIEPNYDATPTQVYAALVKTFLEREQSLRLIAFTGSAVREARPLFEGLPTWAPDLRRDARGIAEHAPYWLRPKSYTASADELASATISDDLKSLETDCLMLGKIDSSEGCANEMKVNDVEDTLCHLLYFALSRTSTVASSAVPLHDTLFRTFVYYWDDQHLGLSAERYQSQQLDMQHMMLGYMAYIGYLDRVQDHLEASHTQAAQDTKVYLFRTIEVRDPTTGETSRTAVLGSATDTLPKMIRPAWLTSRVSRAGDSYGDTVGRSSSKPTLSDYENFVRFFQLFGMDTTNSSENDSYICLWRDFLSEHDCSWTRDMQDWPHKSDSLKTMLSTLKNRVQRFNVRFATVSQRKAFFHTDSGYFGLGLKPTRVGDYVCILRGCSVPLIVREQDGNGRFEVVGQCYVWGAMYGEAIVRMSEKNQKWESLTFV
ncbi:heterokaryon incompatibility protein-domain-containing protein [Lophiotrema nucula]|uniref:Heterokaryon incompatibility protein-domain-containing protein n=1 Tax=Lophiotrema nucula TaxID=690887 RepID=A0A6A5YP81_9PLEO|nr:heterokaryon incompatibility protein-domain-containing protein [Lophiotrema nucula]